MGNIIAQHGTTTYAILWAIVFCETGLVLTPFLPGDSLLFAAGAFAGRQQRHLLVVEGCRLLGTRYCSVWGPLHVGGPQQWHLLVVEGCAVVAVGCSA
jgi:hypothetical protein